MKVQRGGGVVTYNSALSLISAPDGGERSTPRSGRFTSRKSPVTYCTGNCVGFGAGLDGCGKSSLAGIRTTNHTSHNESLYRLT